MRNLSYRETGISLVLIAAAAIAAYQSWFAPALAQTERDRQAVARILSGLAKQRVEKVAPMMSATVLPVVTQPQGALPQLSSARTKTRAARKTSHEPTTKKVLDLSCPESDPLCGAM